jgi:EAL domain-containing protein (putative c-di-GMP-specific phosphodiesterase class I)
VVQGHLFAKAMELDEFQRWASQAGPWDPLRKTG